MFHKFMISLCCVLAPMMVYQNLNAMGTSKKDRQSAAMSKNNATVEQDDRSCQNACLIIPTVFCATVAMSALEDPSDMENMCKYALTGATTGFALGGTVYTLYDWCRLCNKEKQD